jgi:hypothetical protein
MSLFCVVVCFSGECFRHDDHFWTPKIAIWLNTDNEPYRRGTEIASVAPPQQVPLARPIGTGIGAKTARSVT